ncbi:Arm DNA-binding domain-containing protein [Pectobacterium araliae]|uniref:Arm DNA-binding domain-containing protein n=1 Tax=Pectobacterium araliae TaxID=3073862 RepID=UPI003D180E78
MHFQFFLRIGRIWGQVGSMMKRPQMPLNDSKIRNLKPSEKPFKVSDSHGLHLLVNPSGSRLWYLKYRINRKEYRFSLNSFAK